MNAAEFSEKVRNKEIDIVGHIKKVISECERLDSEYHYFNNLAKDYAIRQAMDLAKNPKGRLAGVAVSIKDALCVKGIECRAGSRILTGYKPVFDATVVARIKKEGGIIIGTTAQDEFGFGAFSVNVGLGMKIPLNPLDKERTCGGSSGGAAGLSKKADFPHIAIGESTGGSIASPGSLCGVNALCPTYGRVSRYGLMDYANSLDKIGPMAKDASEVALMMSVISGHDEMDSTSLNEPVPDYAAEMKKGVKGLRIGIIKEGFDKSIDGEVIQRCREAINKLESMGAKCEEVGLPVTIKYGVAAYYMLATSEASTNLAKYCGMRYGKHEKLEGNFNEYFTKVRSLHFGNEAKRRIILGTFARMSGFRDAFYMKAAKVRTLIIDEFKEHFARYDVLVSPAVPFVAPRFDEIERMTPLQHYFADILLVGPNMGGFPHMSMDAGGKLPVGLLGVADHLKEANLLRIADALR